MSTVLIQGEILEEGGKKYDYFPLILHGNSKLLSFKMNCIFLTKLGALSPREFWIGANNKKFMVQYLG